MAQPRLFDVRGDDLEGDIAEGSGWRKARKDWAAVGGVKRVKLMTSPSERSSEPVMPSR